MVTTDFSGVNWRNPIFAIDPGTTHSAYVVWDGAKIISKGKLLNAEMLEIIRLWDAFDRSQFVIEMIGHYGSGMSVGKEVFETCVWIGRYVEACDQGGHEALLVKRTTVKMHLCGLARAKDPNVRQALIDRLGAPGTKANPGVTYGVSADVWQALALAVTVFEQAEKNLMDVCYDGLRA